MEFDIPALWQPFAAIGNISSILTRRFKKKKKKKRHLKKIICTHCCYGTTCKPEANTSLGRGRDGYLKQRLMSVVQTFLRQACRKATLLYIVQGTGVKRREGGIGGRWSCILTYHWRQCDMYQGWSSQWWLPGLARWEGHVCVVFQEMWPYTARIWKMISGLLRRELAFRQTVQCVAATYLFWSKG